MATFIDISYFQKRLLSVPNIDKAFVEENLNDYIDMYQDSFLDKMLGVKLKNQFIAAIDGGDPIDQKWLDLRDGKEYEVSGIVYKWRGFINTDKVSPIANYIFCKFITDNQTLNTGVGSAKLNAENATIIPAHFRMSRVWNEMVALNLELVNFLTEFDSDYPDWYFDYGTTLLIKDNAIGF